MSLSDDIRRARLMCRLSQEDLAQKLGVVRTTVMRWETGRTIPHPAAIVKLCSLCRARKVPCSELKKNWLKVYPTS